MIRVFIGYDRREAVGLHVLHHSIIRRASAPVAVTPIALDHLNRTFRRDLDPLQSTEFAFSRFLTPWLAGYEGWAIFMDCDCVCLADIAELWALRDDRYAVMCVKHDHRPEGTRKFLGAAQTQYEKKNWSSVMLMNAARCRALSPAYVAGASGLDLHRFRWLGDDGLIGALPDRWNHLVGYSDGPLEAQAILHYTEGAPYFAAYSDAKWADVWRQERDAMLAVAEVALGTDSDAADGR